MAKFFNEFQHLKIKLEEIKSATNNFGDDNLIGRGGFGKVYKGTISHPTGQRMAAFKRLDSKLGQGNSEFWKEITMLSRYTHENLVSLLGYCDEGGEKILVYELESRGSLDRHLSSTALTWIQRLRICLGVARGLCYLHDPMGTQQRVIHRDIKSSNILLDENWNAKVSDMGLSKIGHANQQHTLIVTNVVGTLGYLDPVYLEKGMLTKESDVYSFGVVLFEALCGSLCFEYTNRQYQILVPLWRQSYEEKKIDDIIFQDLKQQMNFTSLETFLDIAYLCLLKSHEERPLMALVVEKLEIALQLQERNELMVPKEYEAIFKSAIIPVVFKSKEELLRLLSKGVLTNQGETWFSLNENEEHCELISAKECLNPSANEYCSEENSRFADSCYRTWNLIFGVHVKAQFLSPGITYKVNLVLKFFGRSYPPLKVPGFRLKYQIEGETESSISLHANRREDGWMTIELYQFISNGTNFDLDIRFEGNIVGQTSESIIEGIEFRPVNKRLSLAANGKKCLILPARACLEAREWEWISLPESRFKEVAAHCYSRSFNIHNNIKSGILSPQTTYACYLIYKIIKNHSAFQVPSKVSEQRFNLKGLGFIYLISPLTRVSSPNDDQITYSRPEIPKVKGFPRLRTDGWMEVQAWEFQTDTTSKMISINLHILCHFEDVNTKLDGFIVQGVELKPL